MTTVRPAWWSAAGAQSEDAAARPSAGPFRARSRRRDGEGGAIGAWGGAFGREVLVGVGGSGVFKGKKSKRGGITNVVRFHTSAPAP